MSHDTQRQFVARVRAMWPAAFRQCRVLEIGSFNVNGTVRDFFTDCEYVGVDVGPGPGVDLVCPDGYAAWAVRHGTPEEFDTVISAEMLEHDCRWRTTLASAVVALKRGGLMVLTCAGSGRPEHGTKRTSPQDSLLQTDYYCGLDEADLRSALPLEDFLLYDFSKCDWPSDSYFWGVKK